MAKFLIVIAAIILICVFLNKVSSRVGVPVLLLFIFLGMAFGVGEDFGLEATRLVESLCSFALIFIMFYGGFGTRWKTARPVVVESGVLATLGVFLTAAFVGLFCHFALGWKWIESLLMGSVISSTDAASVFNILRTRNIGLKNNTAPLLEIESGSNDPCSNILTIVMLSLLSGGASAGQVAWMVVAQFLFGALAGLLIAQGAAWVLKRYNLSSGGFDSMFMLAVALLAYAVPSVIGGNGYLSTYIVGIVLGNLEFRGRKTLVGFFDGVTSLMQIAIFFVLGLMVSHRALLSAFVPAMLIFVFLTLVARPLAVGSILAPIRDKTTLKRRYPFKQCGLISFVGLRGASSIVFAIMTITQGAALEHDIFSVVFVIVLVSISLQGSLIPRAAKAFDMEDKDSSSRTTFSDFSDSSDVFFGRLDIGPGSPWIGCPLKEIGFPKEMLLVMIIRGGERIVPDGGTVLQEGDRLIFCSKSYQNETEANLTEHVIRPGGRWVGRPLMEYSKPGSLVLLIKRGEESIIPDGRTIMQADDTLVILSQSSLK